MITENTITNTGLSKIESTSTNNSPSDLGSNGDGASSWLIAGIIVVAISIGVNICLAVQDAASKNNRNDGTK